MICKCRFLRFQTHLAKKPQKITSSCEFPGPFCWKYLVCPSLLAICSEMFVCSERVQKRTACPTLATFIKPRWHLKHHKSTHKRASVCPHNGHICIHFVRRSRALFVCNCWRAFAHCRGFIGNRKLIMTSTLQRKAAVPHPLLAPLGNHKGTNPRVGSSSTNWKTSALRRIAW